MFIAMFSIALGIESVKGSIRIKSTVTLDQVSLTSLAARCVNNMGKSMVTLDQVSLPSLAARCLYNIGPI